MIIAKFRYALLGAVFLLPACTFFDDSDLSPSLNAPDPAGQASAEPAPTGQGSAGSSATSPAAVATQQPALGTGNFVPTGVTPGEPTGTFVGQKTVELREELGRLQGAISDQNGRLQQLRSLLVDNSQRYHGTIAAVNARLQVGTTPGNPILVQQFNSAQQDLDRIAADLATMNQLATEISSSSTLSSFLAESTRAALQVSGAVDEDHRQLAILQDEVERTDVLIERLLTEISSDVRRQTNYVSTERANLNLLSAGIKSGEIFGGNLSNVALAAAGGGGASNLAASPQDIAGRRPLVVIRFDRKDVPYQQALYNAVSRVLEQRPGAVFDLVGVSPTSGGTAQAALNKNKSLRHAENVLRDLIGMGLPASRVAIAQRQVASARTNEVHLYLR